MHGPLLVAAIAVLVQAPPRFAQVTFVSGGQIYVSAGREHGVAEGMELAVLRGDTVAATLRVQFVSSRQAACIVTRGATDVAAGDRVRYVPAPPDSAAPAVTTAAPAPPRATAASRRPGSPGLHGRLSSRYALAQVGGAGSLAQPGLDARVTGVDLGGTAFGFVADVRGRSWRSSLAGGATNEMVTDIYQLALLWHQPGAPLRVAVGRQYLTAVSSIVLLDGALVELNRRRASVGLFGGAEPAWGDSSTPGVRDLGAYVQVRSSPGAAGRLWTFTLGAAGSYAAGQPNREFGFAQLSIFSPAFSLFASQQLDYYRGDKVAAGEHPWSLTSGYLAATVRAGRRLTFDAGFDDRRNVRLFRDLADPLAVFDDSYRRAAWGGASFAGGRLRLRVEGRGSAGGTGTSSAVTASAGLDRLALGLGVGGRVTRYRSAQSSGWLGALRVGADPTAILHVEVNGGARRETDPPAAFGVRSTIWYGAEANVSAGRAWYTVLSVNREAGPDGAFTQVYASMSWRF